MRYDNRSCHFMRNSASGSHAWSQGGLLGGGRLIPAGSLTLRASGSLAGRLRGWGSSWGRIPALARRCVASHGGFVPAVAPDAPPRSLAPGCRTSGCFSPVSRGFRARGLVARCHVPGASRGRGHVVGGGCSVPRRLVPFAVLRRRSVPRCLIPFSMRRSCVSWCFIPFSMTRRRNAVARRVVPLARLVLHRILHVPFRFLLFLVRGGRVVPTARPLLSHRSDRRGDRRRKALALRPSFIFLLLLLLLKIFRITAAFSFSSSRSIITSL